MACARPKGTAELPPLSSLKAENKAPVELIFHLEKDSKGTVKIVSDNSAFGKNKIE